MNRIELFSSLLKQNNQNLANSLLSDLVEIIKNEEVLIHDLGVFEVKHVLDVILSKIKMQNQNIQKHNIVGFEQFAESLENYHDSDICQFTITSAKGAFQVITDTGLENLIGISYKPEFTIQLDIDHQALLAEKGHPNKNIYKYYKGTYEKVY